MNRLRPALVVFFVVACGMPRWARADDAGYALRFDGVSDYVTLASTASMLAAGWQTTKTVSLWVKPTGSPVCTGADPASCDAILGDKPRTWGISRGAPNGIDRIWVWNYDGTFDKIGVEYTPGEWTHIALVHDGGQLSAYKNGALVGTVASGATPSLNGTAVLQLGGIINNSSRNWTFEGEIDEVQVWASARTGAEIGATMYGGLTGSETGLAAYYRMSNGSGSSLTDDSGHSWTGTLRDGGINVPPDGPITWVASGAFGTPPPPTNTPPVAEPQALATAEDTAVAIVLTGWDADGDGLTYRVVSQPAHGVLSGTGANVTYTPAAHFNGADSFTFVVNDGYTDSPAQPVSLTVAPVNDPPSATDDSASTAMDTAVVVSVLSNDLDVDGDPLAITAVDDPANGTVSYDFSQITYTPDSGFTGGDSFSYTISDGQGGVATGQVSVTVRPPGADPGYALRLDGVSDFVTLAETSLMMASGWQSQKTVDLWVKPTGSSFCNAPSPASCDAIVGDRPRWWGISRGVINGLDRIWVWNYDGQMQAIAIAYTPGAWTHIAMVHGGGTMSAYKDGVLVGTVASGATQQPSTGALPIMHLGGVINTTTRNWTFEGEIDEVRFWNTARGAEEIAQDMSLPLEVGASGLAAYYRMSNGSGALATDDSGFGWEAKLHDGGSGVPADGAIMWVPSGAFTVAD